MICPNCFEEIRFVGPGCACVRQHQAEQEAKERKKLIKLLQSKAVLFSYARKTDVVPKTFQIIVSHENPEPMLHVLT